MLGLEAVACSLDQNLVAAKVIHAVETELICLLGASGKEASMMRGRSNGPKFAMRTAVGPPGNCMTRCSRVTSAWDTVSTWLRLVLIHWGSEWGGSGSLPTLSRAKWKLVHHEWKDLSDSANAIVFKRWIDAVRLCDFNDKVKVHLR
jgi:hypothetical protein